MDLHIGPSIQGRPTFYSGKTPRTNKPLPLMGKSSLLRKIAPSSRRAQFLFRIKLLIQRLLSPFTLHSPNMDRERWKVLLRPINTEMDNVTFSDLVEHYQEKNASFLPSSVRACLTEWNKERKTLSSTKEKTPELSTQLVQKWKRMKPGSSRLVSLHFSDIKQEKGDLFCLITKNTGESYSFRFLGSGSMMATLTATELPLGGKEKVPKDLLYANIPSSSSSLEKFFFLLADETVGADLSAVALREKLTEISVDSFRQAMESSKELTAKTAKMSQLFWNVVDSIPPTAKERGERSKQSIKLRSELLHLFTVYHESRHGLDPTTPSFAYLQEIHEGVAKNVARAFSKGHVSDEDLQRIRKELDQIAAALRKAQRKGRYPRPDKNRQPNFILPGNEVFSGPSTTPANIPIKKEVLNPEKRERGIPPNGSYPKLAGIAPIAISSYKKIATKEAFLRTLRDRKKLWESAKTEDEKEEAREEMLDLLRDIPFALDDKEALWWKLQRGESDEIVQTIEAFSDTITQQKEFVERIGQKSWEGLMKSLFILSFLQSESTNKSFSDITTHLSVLLSNYTENDPSTTTDSARLENDILGHSFHQIQADSILLLKELFSALKILETRGREVYFLQTFKDPDYRIIKKQQDNLDRIFRTTSPSTFFLPKRLPHWQRPIRHPLLLAVYRQATTWIDGKGETPSLSSRWTIQSGKSGEQDEKAMKKRFEEKFGFMTPEAFQTDPEGIFEYFYEDLRKGMEDVNEKEPLSPSVTRLPFSKEEERRLLQLLRHKAPQAELLAFIRDFPHLIRIPDIRNFLDGIFFQGPLLNLFGKKIPWKSTCENRISLEKEMPQQIEQQITVLANRVSPPFLEETAESADERVREIDTLLYFYELQERLRQIYANVGLPIDSIPDHRDDLAHLLERLAHDPRWVHSATYAARVYLRTFFREAALPNEALPQIFFAYAIVQGGPIDPMNVDPTLSRDLEQLWRKITRASKESSTLDGKEMAGFLNRICYGKNIPLLGKEWCHEGNLVYTNGTYTIDCETSKVAANEVPGYFDTLPDTISCHPTVREFLPELGKKLLPTNRQEIERKVIYTFFLPSGQKCQIEQEEERLAFYQWVGGENGHWVQRVPQEMFDAASAKESSSLLSAFKNRSGKISYIPTPKRIKAFFLCLIHALKRRSFRQVLPESLCTRFALNPAKPSQGYVLNEQGEIQWEWTIRKTKRGVVLTQCLDHRESPPSGPWELNSLACSDVQGLAGLKQIENPQNILLWSQKGRVKKVELPRYGLTFTVEKGRLFSTHPDWKGYAVELHPTPAEKKGLPYSLLLKHADLRRPKILVVPDSNHLEKTAEQVEATAGVFAQPRLVLDRIKQQLLPSQSRYRPTYQISERSTSLPYYSFDLRPFTEEICPNTKEGIEGLLSLLDHALLVHQPTLAVEIVEKLAIEEGPLDQKRLDALMAFLRNERKENPEATAIQIRLALQITAHLKKHKRLRKELRQPLNDLVIERGKAYFAAGRRVPTSLQLQENERMEILHLMKKYDPEYYQTHAHHFIASPGESVAYVAENDRWDTLYEAWKKTLPPGKIDGAIEALEERLRPAVPLSEESLQHAIPRLPAGEALLFTPDTLKRLFQEKENRLPPLTIPRNGERESPFEKVALDAFEKEVASFREEEEKRPHYTIGASRKEMERFVKKSLYPKKVGYEKTMERLHKEIEERLCRADSAEEQVALYAGERAIASFASLRIALGKNSLEELREAGRLPDSVSIDALKQALGAYFDALSRKSALETAMRLIEEMEASGARKDPVRWETLSTTLHRLLTIERHYDASSDPRLLAFEAQQFILFKPLEGGLDQLSLLETVLSDPYALVQAPTGAGKTSVLSVMRSLLQPNGENLVIQQVLPALYQQTLEKMEDVLGDLFGEKIFPLRFHLKMRLTVKEKKKVQNTKGEWDETMEDVSLFKGMYCKMLETMENRGCVLTDYKSLPLLEEKFWKLGQEMIDCRANHEPIDPLTQEHYHYLRKILLLLQNRGQGNMDEFDQPNRPIHKVLLDLGVGDHPLPPFLVENTLAMYDLLAEDPALGLEKNIQGDIPKERREEAIGRLAATLAKSLAAEVHSDWEEEILDYLLGRNEAVLARVGACDRGWTDRLALAKEQCSLFLPLTLSYKQGNRYKRSEDGKRTSPCFQGERHDAKFGTLLEQVNYTLQDYLQAGITEYDLTKWFRPIDNQWDFASEREKGALEKRVEEFLPLSVPAIRERLKTPEGVASLVEAINKDRQKIRYFAEVALRELKTSGFVIEMDPQNIVDMQRAVSGVSATTGAPESLHRQFVMEEAIARRIRSDMAFRLCKRGREEKGVIHFDPTKPEEILDKAEGPIQALIDGAGAFQGSGREVAERLKNSGMQQVGYHEGERVAFVGEATGDLSKTGFYFNQAHTRGTDIPLDPHAEAILTLSGKDGLRDFFQKEGRLRQPTQKYRLAVTNFETGVETIGDQIAQAIRNDAAIDAQDIFRKSKQEIRATVRKGLRDRLLEQERVEDFLSLFEKDEIRSFFIKPPAPHYEKTGDFFTHHQTIRKMETQPDEALSLYKERMRTLAEGWGLTKTVESLDRIAYSEALLAKMPLGVEEIREGVEETEMEHEVEAEEEQEAEAELEIAVEMESEEQKVGGKPSLGRFPRRLENQNIYRIAGTGAPYDDKLTFSDAFLPLSRKGMKASRQRALFDESMYRVGTVFVQDGLRGYWGSDSPDDPLPITRVVLEDPVEDTMFLKRIHGSFANGFHYDIRTRVISKEERVFDGLESYETYRKRIEKTLASPEFHHLIAQVKFFDGQMNGYTPEEERALAQWLKNYPRQIKDHFLNEVLKYRFTEQRAFPGSQLEAIFQALLLPK